MAYSQMALAKCKIGFKHTFLIGLASILMFSACGDSTASSEESNQDSVQTAVEEIAATASEKVANSDLEQDADYDRFADFSDSEDESKGPTPKPEEDLAALKKMREQAFKAEKTFFETPRISSWVSKLATTLDEESETEYGKLETGKFHQLNAKEAFYYYLVHPEMWDQICAETIFEAGDVLAIAQNLPFTGDGDHPSERQEELVKKNWPEIEGLVLDCIQKNNAISPEMMQVVVDFSMKSSIPVLTKIFKEQSEVKDDLILTTFVAMMNRANYKEWTDSEIAKEFKSMWWETIPLNDENVDKILFYAKKFAAS